MKKAFTLFAFPAISLILELLPYGAVCRFANPEGESFRETFSYFDLVPFGYGNVGPFLAAIGTCIALICLLTYFISKKELAVAVARVILALSFLASLGPLSFGLPYFSVVGAAISLTLLAGGIVLGIHVKGL